MSVGLIERADVVSTSVDQKGQAIPFLKIHVRSSSVVHAISVDSRNDKRRGAMSNGEKKSNRRANSEDT